MQNYPAADVTPETACETRARALEGQFLCAFASLPRYTCGYASLGYTLCHHSPVHHCPVPVRFELVTNFVDEHAVMPLSYPLNQITSRTLFACNPSTMLSALAVTVLNYAAGTHDLPEKF